MIRPLMITFAVASVVAIAAGVGVSILHPAKFGHFDNGGSETQDPGPVVTRDFTWAGSPNLTISVPAEVTYIQGPTAKVTATGNSAVLDELEVTNDEVGLKEGCNFSWGFSVGDRKDQNHVRKNCNSLFNNHGSPLKITITGPSTEKFQVNGAAKLDIQSYDRPDLKLDVSGAAKLTAAGKVKTLDADLSGATEADLGNLEVTDASLDISGVGHAKLKATGDVSVDISGAGAVELLTKPAHLTQDISGAGHISQP
jgi:hypothetical protein